MLTHTVNIRRRAIFSPDRTSRFELHRWWVEAPVRFAVWLCLNPSWADSERDDLTCGRIIRFSMDWGYDGAKILNVYPFVTPDPKEMWVIRRMADADDYAARDAMQRNKQVIEEVAVNSALRMVAFGAQPAAKDQPWLEQVLEAYSQPSICGAEEQLYCIGTTASGQPIHPLARGRMRVPDTAKPQAWSLRR